MKFRVSSSASPPVPTPSHGSTLLATRYPLPATSSLSDLRSPTSDLRPQVSGLRSQVSRRSAAFTLVELLIGATLSAAVLAAVLSSYLFLSRQLARLAHQQTLETQARSALGYFAQDVQRATGLVTISSSPTSPAANRVDLTVPTGTGTVTVTWYYNPDLTDSTTLTLSTPSGSPTSVAVPIPAASLTRCVNDGTTVTSLTLLRYITDGDTAEDDNDLLFRFFDSSGNEYTSYTNYLPGIKQVALEFVTQTGTAASGTQTPLNRSHSGRLALRNRGFLQ